MIPEPAHLHCQQLLIQVVSKNAKIDSLKLLDSVNPTLIITRPESPATQQILCIGSGE
jgi:hypothetical protein